MTLFHDWGAKFYFNAAIAAAVAVVVVLPDARHAAGAAACRRSRNTRTTTRRDYSADDERTFTYREIFVEHVLTNRYLWAIAVANAFVYFVRYGVVNWIPTYLQTAKGFSFQQSSTRLGALRVRRDSGHDRVRLDVGHGLQGPARAGDDPVHGA